jgi:hypothetical protein
MKRHLSILLTLLILLSRIHFSVASHTCSEGKAEIKFSVSEKKATCGMENGSEKCPIHNGISTNCCHDEVSVYEVDNNYSPTSFHLNLLKQSLQFVALPAVVSIHTLAFYTTQHKESKPPGKTLTRAVYLADICVFRI